VSAPDGFPLWVGDVTPGSVHDLTAAREHVLGALYWAASQLDLPTLADGGYDSAGIGVHTPVTHSPPTVRCSMWIPAPAPPCYTGCAVWANADAPCPLDAGVPLRHLTTWVGYEPK
jgi:hypothetical protein